MSKNGILVDKREKGYTIWALDEMNKLFKYLKSKNKYQKNEELLRAAAKNNCVAGMGAFVLVLMIGLLGTFGEFLPFGTIEVFPKIKGISVYVLAIMINSVLITILQDLKTRLDLIKPEYVLDVCYIGFLLNAILSGLTIFSTQEGSSIFFELVIIMTILCALPFYRTIRGWFVILFSLGTFLILDFMLDLHMNIAWQDLFDIVIFYIMSEIYIYIHRANFIESVKLQNAIVYANRELMEKSRTDSLTGLMNRMALDEDIRNFVGSHLCAAMLDFDSFKKANDSRGHAYGDYLLQSFAEELRKDSFFSKCRCYRYGGDEFLIIFLNDDVSSFTLALSRMQAMFSDPVSGFAQSISAGYSYGQITSLRQLNTCIRIADEQLYEAKSQGRNHICGKHFVVSEVNGKIEENIDDDVQDILTGLLNQKGFSHALKDKDLEKLPWTVIALDIDRFQDINKEFGYAAGSTILERVGHLISRTFPNAVSARLESDHFSIFTGSTDVPDIQRRIEELQKNSTAYLPHWRLVIRAGIWTNRGTDHTTSMQSALDMAKYACDSLRHQSNVLIRMYDEKLDETRKNESYIVNNLGDALYRGQIVPYFQRIVRTSDERTAGFEVLTRWMTEEGKVISPGVFIPVLERTMDVYRVDFSVFRSVCAMLTQLPKEERDRYFLSFNFSRTDFDSCDVHKEIDKIIEEYDLPRSLIRVEITESAMAETRIRKIVKELRHSGYRVCIDDFGSGSSSLNVLKDYDVEVVKLDMDFMKDFHTNPKSRIIIKDLTTLCKSLGMNVVIEGVETREQVEFVRAIGADYIQGFFYSRPESLNSILESLDPDD